MSEEERKKLYEDAISTWGLMPQIFMVFEETGELLSALAKHYRGRNNPEDVVTELADVNIMTEQMATIFGCDNFIKEKEKS